MKWYGLTIERMDGNAMAMDCELEADDVAQARERAEQRYRQRYTEPGELRVSCSPIQGPTITSRPYLGAAIRTV